MALPRALSGINYAPNGGRHGPFESGGNYYFFAVDSTNVYSLEVWKSANMDTTAPTMVASDTVLDTSTTIRSIDVVQDGTDLKAIIGTSDGTNVDYQFYIFSMSSDSFTTTDENAFTISADTPLSINVYGSLAVRSDGSVVALIQDAQPKVMGTAYMRVSYLKRSSGGTWDGTTTAVDDGGNIHYSRPRSVLGASNKIHFVYYDLTNLQHKSLNSSDTLSSAEAVNDTAIAQDKPALAYLNDGTNDLVMVIWAKSSNDYVYSSLITNDGTPAAEAAVSTNGVRASTFPLDIAADGTNNKFYAIWTRGGDSDNYYSEYTPGSGWGSVQSLHAGITCISIYGANVYTNDSSATVLAFLANETASLNEYYHEYVLSGGGLTVNLTFISSGSALYAQSATVEPQVNLTFIASTSVLYNPAMESAVVLGFISSTSTPYAQTANVVLSVSLGFISSTSTLYAVVTESTITPGFISSSSALYALSATVEPQVDLGFIASSTALYAPTIGVEVLPGFISSSSALYAPTISQTINLTFVGSTSVLYAVTETSTIVLGFIASSTTVYAQSAAVAVNIGFIPSTTTLYSLVAQVEPQIDLGFIGSTTALYNPSVESTITPGFIASTSTLYSPTANVVLSVSLGFIASTSALYGLTVTSTVALGFISSSSALYALTASAGLSINLTFISSTSSLYSVTDESTITPAFIASASTLYNPSLESTIALGFISTSSALYSPSITLGGLLDIFLTFIPSTTMVYTVSVLLPPPYEIDINQYHLQEIDISQYHEREIVINQYHQHEIIINRDYS